ncbi:MAG: hypothetical protein LLF96_09385 [Eubacteriales bacterium]|nr:hypothetical protein [Eubacteriales bacterium]
MKRRWTEQEITTWYDAQPWITGFNFYPSTCINQTETWQEFDHKRVTDDIGKELSLAASLGYNNLRTLFPFELWRVQPDIFFRHVEEFLSQCATFGISVMPVLFDDCCVPKSLYQPMEFGKQPEPVPGYFGGSPVTCFEATEKVGYNPTDDEGMAEIVKEYITQLAAHFGQDERILLWNVWNEAGNSNRGSKSLPMIRNVFCWLREADVSQPLTAEVFASMPSCPFPDEYLRDPRIESEIELAMLELSDITSFHYYGDYLHMRLFIRRLRAYGRPLICDEWLHRPMGSFIQTHLPLLKKERVGSYMFGFVNGKTQFNEVWEYLKGRPSMDTRLWMHDIFRSDFSPYDPEEIALIRQCNADLKTENGL